MRTQYKKNMRITQLEVFKRKKGKTQAQMMEDIIVIDRDSCLFCTVLLFVLLFFVLTLYSFRFSIYSTLEIKTNSLTQKLLKFESKILNMSKSSEIEKNKILPENLARVFSSKCFPIFNVDKANLVVLNKEIKYDLATVQGGFSNIVKIEKVHFATIYKIKMEIEDKKMDHLKYNLTTIVENSKQFIRFEAPGIKLTEDLEICVLVSGKGKGESRD